MDINLKPGAWKLFQLFQLLGAGAQTPQPSYTASPAKSSKLDQKNREDTPVSIRDASAAGRSLANYAMTPA